MSYPPAGGGGGGGEVRGVRWWELMSSSWRVVCHSTARAYQGVCAAATRAWKTV